MITSSPGTARCADTRPVRRHRSSPRCSYVRLKIYGSTDHVSFDRAGIPGFQFIQDPLDYGTRTHHSSQDFFERLVPADMRHNAVAVATFAFLAANRDAPLPRKPMVQ